MPEIEVAECGDLIQLARCGWAIEPFDGEMPQPNSQDSYNYFVRLNPYMSLAFKGRQEREREANRRSSLAAKLQAEWEESMRRRQENREEISAWEWALAIERRKGLES